jgi:hypothetical protein
LVRTVIGRPSFSRAVRARAKPREAPRGSHALRNPGHLLRGNRGP